MSDPLRRSRLRTARAEYVERLFRPRPAGIERAEIRARIDLIDLELSMEETRRPDDQAAIEWLRSASPELVVLAHRPDPVRTRDRFRPMVVRVAETVLEEIEQTPRLTRISSLTTLDAEALDDLRFSAAVVAPQLGAVDPDILTNLRVTPLRWWEPIARNDRVGLPVLVPVRLETRFAQEDGEWRLRLMVVPDEAWIDTHRADVTELEAEALAEFWEADDEVAGFARLAEVVGGPRAAWLVAAFDGSLGDTEPVPADELIAESKITGFPDFLHLYIARGGQPAVVVDSWPVRTDELSIEVLGGLDDNPQWWNNFPSARHVGLGREVRIGPTVDDIDALYVIGLGGGDAVELFSHHAASGRMGLLAPGSPTNTVSGEADPGAEPTVAGWRRLATADLAPTEMETARVICGDPAALRALPGGRTSSGEARAAPTEAAQAVTALLWPALVGHTMADLLGGADEFVHRLASVAVPHLCPEGASDPVRVGPQPYGVVIATDLRAWEADEAEPPVIAELARFAAGQLRRFSAAGEAAGTADGATADELLAVIGRTPLSSELRTRKMIPIGIGLWMFVFARQELDLTYQEMLDRIADIRQVLEDSLGATVGEFGRDHIHVSGSQLLDLPIVLAEDRQRAEALANLIDSIEGRDLLGFSEVLVTELELDEASLLARLMVRSAQVATAAIGRSLEEADRGAIAAEPLTPVLEDLFIIQDPTGDPAIPNTRLTRMQRWIRRAATGDPSPRAGENERLAQLTDALRAIATVPVADLERLVVGVLDCASHRIDAWAAIPAHFRLRALDAAAVAIPRRLGAYGWVDAPRPRAVDDDPAAGGLLFSPTEEHALTAAVLRDRALADPDRYAITLSGAGTAASRRLAAAVRTGTHPAEHVGSEVERIVERPGVIESLRTRFPLRAELGERRVCNGLAVLAAARTEPQSLGLPTDVLAKLATLDSLVDDYADLLLVEAAFRVVSGRGDRAGAPLEAAAGFAPPPELDLLRSGRTGTTVETAVVLVVPQSEQPALPTDAAALATIEPLTVAEPSLEGYLAWAIAPPDEWNWEVAVAGTADATTIQLGDLGLRPIPSLTYSTTQLEEAALARSGLEGAAIVDRAGTRHRERLGRLVRLASSSLAPTVDTAAEPEADADVRRQVDLLQRLDATNEVLAALADALRAVTMPDEASSLLAAARQWGVPALLNELPDPVAAAADVAREFENRLGREVNEKSVPDDVVAALRSRIGPQGDLACFVTGRAGDLGSIEVVADADTFELDWLAVVADVRPRLAKALAGRLDGLDIVPFSSDPTTLWPTDGDAPAHVVVLSTVDLDALTNDDPIAYVILDRWTETIPDTAAHAAAALGFDAPRARAPQAIIVTVPPRPGTDPEVDEVVAVVEQVRQLARARAALPEQLVETGALLPVTAMPVFGPTGVKLNEEDQP